MSDLTDRLDEYEARVTRSRLGRSVWRETDDDLRAISKTVGALRAVLDLHRDAGPSQGYGANFKGGYGEFAHCCGTCGAHGEYGVEWPCPTVQAVADALGVEP